MEWNPIAGRSQQQERQSTMGTHTVNTVETHDQAVVRLAEQARGAGVRVLVYPQTNEHFAESASHPGELHRLTMVSCDCPGFLRHRRCRHNAALLALYGNLPPLDPEPEPDGGGAALPVPTEDVDVVLSVVPAPSIDQHNAAVAARYLDGPRGQAETFALLSDLRGESYHRACGMTAAAIAGYCEAIAGEATPVLVCPSPSCGGRGYFQSHPEDDRVRCDTCNGRGIVPGHSVAVAVFAVEPVAIGRALGDDPTLAA